MTNITINNHDFLGKLSVIKNHLFLALEDLSTSSNQKLTDHLKKAYRANEELINLSKTNNIAFIEDVCQSFGAEFNGKKLGTFGKLGCFSFYPTKMLHTCGHGGALVTNKEKYYKAVKIFVESGRADGEMTEEVALNLRMDEVRAEFLLHELADYENKIKRQRKIAGEFIRLIPVPQPFLKERDEDRHIYSIFNLCLKKRDKFRSYMDGLGIETLIYYGDDVLPKKEKLKYKELTSTIVAIPCRWNLISKEIRRIKEALKGWFK